MVMIRRRPLPYFCDAALTAVLHAAGATPAAAVVDTEGPGSTPAVGSRIIDS
jgi:hypothetical protein